MIPLCNSIQTPSESTCYCGLNNHPEFPSLHQDPLVTGRFFRHRRVHIKTFGRLQMSKSIGATPSTRNAWRVTQAEQVLDPGERKASDFRGCSRTPLPAICTERRKRILSGLLQQVSPFQLYRYVKKLLYALTPTLLRYLIWHEQSTPPKKFPTSYLNGLRGVTAVKVLLFTTHSYSATSDSSRGALMRTISTYLSFQSYDTSIPASRLMYSSALLDI